MRQQITTYLDNAITFLLLFVVGITPLLFLNLTTEFYEMPKLIFLVVSTTVLLGLWIFSWILKGKVTINRTPLDIPLLILLVTVVLSAAFSATKYPAIYGNFPRVHGSAVSWVVYILLYFITTSHINSLAKLKNLLYVLYGSASVITVISLLSFFKVFILPFDFAQAVNFTPTGSSFSTVAFLLMLLPLPLLSLSKNNKYMPVAFAIPIAVLFSAAAVLIGTYTTDVLLVLVFALTTFVAKPQHVKRTLGLFVLPIIITVVVGALAYVSFPGNIIQTLEASFPKEIQLPLSSSWKVSASAFRDAPFVGPGPSTYLFSFTSYKPIEFNQLNIWSFSFDSAYNEFLQVLGTLGILGFAALALISLVIIVNAWKTVSANSANQSQDASRLLTLALSISGLTAIALLLVHATTLVSFVVMLFILASLMMSQESIREKVMEFSVGIKAMSGGRQLDLFPVVLFIIFLVAALPLLYKTYTVSLADYYHRTALSVASKSGTQTYQYLQKAETLNPEVDLYRVDMAQTNFALANALATQKGPTQANPQGTLTDQDKKTIQTLLSQAINEGRVSVALSPRSSRNWSVLGSIYRNIAGVAQNALAFSLNSYGNAIQLEPLNPILRLNVGGIYYSAKSYDLATRFFSDAINLKPDYANAYYNLAIVYRDRGDLQNAALVANQLVVLLQKNAPKSPDLDTANKLLNDLKAQIAANTKETQNAQVAPASQTNSALQNQNISGVKVNNLDNKPEVTVPAPVKSNPNANIPPVSPTPTTTPTPTPALK